MKNILHEIIVDPDFEEGLAWRRFPFYEQQLIVKEGEMGQSLFLVEEGSLRVSGSIAIDEKRIQSGFCDLNPGDIFGEICLLECLPRIATVTALTGGCAIEFNGRMLNAYFEKNPESGYRFYKQLFAIFIERINRANQRVENLLAWGLKAHGIDQHLQ
jgi:CRP/FNR family transcriptional regulator, cyclic AMP receptor protein